MLLELVPSKWKVIHHTSGLYLVAGGMALECKEVHHCLLPGQWYRYLFYSTPSLPQMQDVSGMDLGNNHEVECEQ